MHSSLIKFHYRCRTATVFKIHRQYLSSTNNAGLTKVFDRNLFKTHRNSAVIAVGSDYYDYLRIEMANRLVDRLDDITRKFPLTLDLGCHRGHLYRAINENEGIGGIEHLVQCDVSANAIDQARIVSENGIIETSFVVADEEALPFEDKHFDLVLSSLSMHWINEIPAVLEKNKCILKPDGAFIGCMIGGNSLAELRHCLYLAELDRTGGMSPMYFMAIYSILQQWFSRQMLQHSCSQAGFALPTVDVDTITISYPNAFVLMEHLYCMGESTAALNRQFNVGRDVFLAAASIYQTLYGLEDGSIPATFQVISMIGWSPDASQPGPNEELCSAVSENYLIVMQTILAFYILD